MTVTLIILPHKSGRPPNGPYSVVAGGQNQTAALPLITTLDFYNCYVFGNGVESFRIEDRIDGKFFLLGGQGYGGV